MKAISLKQPWASMIADGRKTIETRTWWTKYRGELVIAVSARPRIRESMGPGWLPAGVTVAMVDLVDCRPMTEKDCEAACCDWYPDAYAWVLSNIRRVTEVPVRGHLGIYDLPYSINFCRVCGTRTGVTSNLCSVCTIERETV